jgi:hypothetical protein
MIAALHLSGTSERTQASSVREVRLLAQCSHTSPDRISAQELQHSFRHRTNVDGLAPASLRLCSSGMRFSSLSTSSNATGPRWRSCARTPPTTSPLSSVWRQCGDAWRPPPLSTTKSPAPRSRAWASGSMKPSSSRSPLLTVSASQAMATAARAPKIGPSPCPQLPSRCCAPPGKPIVLRPGSCPPLGARTPQVRRQLPR